jgi:hypothetical protein
MCLRLINIFSFKFCFVYLILSSSVFYSQGKNYDDISAYCSNPLKLYTNKDGLPQSNVISTAKFGKRVSR